MSDFTVTDAIVAKIAKQYNMPKARIEILRTFYEGFANDMKQQYLAHVIRTMEERLRRISGNEMFRIVCSAVDKTSKELGIARAQYYRNRYFAIYYHPNTDEKQLRVLLAHELGHLFLIEMVNSTLNMQYDENTDIEPTATVFGIFAIFDKNEFYHNKTRPFMHTSPEEILNDFSLLHNRNNGKLNIS
jgi:hypothetical protein